LPYRCDGKSCQERHDLVVEMGEKAPTHTSPQCWYVAKRDKNYEAEVKLLLHDFLSDLEEIGSRVREEVIIPFCKRNQVRFDSGMGAYAFFDKKGREVSSDWERGLNRPGQPPWEFAPADYPYVYRMLNIEVDRSSLLFEYMEGYDAQDS